MQSDDKPVNESSAPVLGRMREDWNRRAVEDANYFVAFGRRGQQVDDFFATGEDLAIGLARELRRLPASSAPRVRRALEIGCGPGRLMKPLSRHFGEIHGVDVSDQMIARARANLHDIPHAHVHTTSGAGLPQFADESFDFIYSYAVFQHIPSREVVFGYFDEIARLLKPGGVFRGQVNGLPPTAAVYDTWSGVRVSAPEIWRVVAGHGLHLLALEGIHTQYMWTTWRKPIRPVPHDMPGASIRRITNAHSSEPVAPSRGRFASIAIWLEGLDDDACLNHLTVRIGGANGVPHYLGAPGQDGLRQLNAMLPPNVSTGLHRVEILWRDRPLCPPSVLRVIPPGPLVPRVSSVTDGVNLVDGLSISSRTIKAVVEEVLEPDAVTALLDGAALTDRDSFCIDPLPPSHEINLRLPPATAAGNHALELRIGHRLLGRYTVTIAPGSATEL